ncbi:MAG: transposase [Desulfobulbaceae bacterium]|nr:transposase [Desulfobulbaceae bacterium]
MKKKRRKFPNEFKEEAVKLDLEQGYPISEAGLIFHSDRGSQYCSNDFQEMLKKYKMLSSHRPLHPISSYSQ